MRSAAHWTFGAAVIVRSASFYHPALAAPRAQGTAVGSIARPQKAASNGLASPAVQNPFPPPWPSPLSRHHGPVSGAPVAHLPPPVQPTRAGGAPPTPPRYATHPLAP